MPKWRLEKMTDEIENEVTASQLKQLFQFAPIADDGFSTRIESSIRRRLWMRRIVLTSAFVVGLILALKPVIELLALAVETLNSSTSLFAEFSLPTGTILGIVLLAAMTLATQMLEE